MKNIGSDVFWFFCFFVRVHDSGVTGGDGSRWNLSLVAQSARVALESGFSTLGVVEKGLIQAALCYLLELPPAP